jgi:hypothetical protein
VLTPLSDIVKEFNERFGTQFNEQAIRWMEDLEATTEADDNARGFLFDKMRDAFMRRARAIDHTTDGPLGM